MDADTNDIVGGINDVLTKDGQNTPTQPLPMGGFRHTGAGNAEARTDYAAAGQVQDGTLNWGGVTAGSANAQTLAADPAIPSLVDGQLFNFRAGFTNTGATTFSVSGLPTHPVHFRGAALVGGELTAGVSGTAIWNNASSCFDLVDRGSASPSDVPTGIVSPFAGSSAPTGYLMCDGSAVSRSAYAALFAVIGTDYGVGDGSTTFNVPDARGRTIAGFDTGNATGRLTGSPTGGVSASTLGNNGGEQGHTLSIGELAVHSHGVTDPQHSHGVTDPQHSHPAAAGAFLVASAGSNTVGGGSNVSTNATTGNQSTGVTVNSASTGITTNNTGSGLAHNNVQPTLILNYIIKT